MRARGLLASGSLGVVAWLLLPLPLFLIAAVVITLVGALCLAGYWYEQAIRVEAERIQLVFEVEALTIDKQHLIEDNDSTLIRLSEVLDEHSLCPVPVEMTDEQHASLVEHHEQALRMISEPIVVEASNVTAFPQQRKGGRS